MESSATGVELAAEVPQQAALQALQEAAGNVKLAVVMAKKRA